MCDPFSLASAGSKVIGGFADATAIKGQAAFESTMARVAGIMAAARGSSDQADLTKEFRRAYSTNLAAAAISGIDISSFSSVFEGNIAEKRSASERIQGNVDAEVAQADANARQIALEGSARAKAAKWSGIIGAVDTMWEAERSYQKTHKKDQSRWDYFKGAFD